MTSRFAINPELIALEEDACGFHLPDDVIKSWKTCEKICFQIATVLRTLFQQDHPKSSLDCSDPPSPLKFGYSKTYTKERKARLAISESIDSFVLLFSYVSFCIAMCRNTGDPASISLSESTQPRWFQVLSARRNRIHPEWLQLLVDSPISNFTTTTQRRGAIFNVSKCTWIHLVPRMLISNIPLWFYWGIPPIFIQPLDPGALCFAPRSHPQSRAPPLPVITPTQSVGVSTPTQSVRIRSAHVGPGQLTGETWKEFMIRQNKRREAKLSKESEADREARESRENSAAKRSCPGKKGPTVYIWENDNGVRTRTLLTRAQVEDYWGNYRSSQQIYNSIDNCWDLCSEFDEGTAGEMHEYDPNDSDDDIYPPTQSRRPPTPKNGRSGDGSASIVVDSIPQSVLPPAHISSDCGTPMVVDLIPPQIPSDLFVDPTTAQIPSDHTMLIDPSDSVPQSVLTSAQVASDSSPMLLDSQARELAPLSLSMPLPQANPQSQGDSISSDEDDVDPYEASRKDVLNAYSFVAPDLEQMPIATLNDLLYYSYGYSLAESPYTGIPSSVDKDKTQFIRSWTEVCRAVGGQQLESSVDIGDHAAIEDFLSILAGCSDPFEDVPGKYWDLSPSGHMPIVNLDKVLISIEERQFTDRKHFIIRPRSLHPSHDMSESWLLSVDSMTALECIRRGLGPHTIDIANFLISHGFHFRTLQRISNSLDQDSEKLPARPHCRYLGYRSVGYLFDLADFAGYETLRDSFLRSQSHGPLALREGGIIARLAREVLPHCNALSGPSSEALSGHCARFVCDDEIYVDDKFSDAELGLLCGTYVLGNSDVSRGGNEIYLFFQAVINLIFLVLPKKVSWFPPANVWDKCGFGVGQWTHECEIWFQKHVAKIRSGTFQPLSSIEWRKQIRFTRLAVKVAYQMKKGAASFISAHQHFLSSTALVSTHPSQSS